MNESTQASRRFAERFGARIHELTEALQDVEPHRLADLYGAQFEPTDEGGGQFYLALWGREISISYPEFTPRLVKEGKEVSPMDQALLLYYLTSADGTPLSERWISFADLPDGRFYNRAFQGYTGDELARAFKNDIRAFEGAALLAGGKPFALGDAAFTFQALPRVPLLAVFWLGDEDFSSTCQVLFNASASHYLPTDAYAILGSTLTRRLISSRSNPDAIRH
jgi:hypothetical protein